MLISFIVPVYNVEKYLVRCLNAILVQRGAPFEVLLIDDGSTDSSGLICDQYAKEYPDVIRVIHKKNEGLLLTRRRGFVEAKGDWYACVDSDDYIKPDYLQSLIKIVNSYNCDLIMFDYESFYPSGKVEKSGIDFNNIHILEEHNKQTVYQKRLLKNKYNNMWSKLIKNTVIDNSLDYSTYGIKNMCEDAIQSYEIYTNAKCIVLFPKALYRYRREVNSITSHISDEYWRALNINYSLGWDYMKLWQMDEITIHAYASRCIAYYCDFLRWLFQSIGYDTNKLNVSIDKEILGCKSYQNAVAFFEKKYLATKYLKLIDPLILRILKFKQYHVRNIFLYGLFHLEKRLVYLKKRIIKK